MSSFDLKKRQTELLYTACQNGLDLHKIKNPLTATLVAAMGSFKIIDFPLNKKPDSGRSQVFVPKAGIEPAHPKIHDFESCASTSSATLASTVSQPKRLPALTGHLNGMQICLNFTPLQNQPSTNFSRLNACERSANNVFT